MSAYGPQRTQQMGIVRAYISQYTIEDYFFNLAKSRYLWLVKCSWTPMGNERGERDYEVTIIQTITITLNHGHLMIPPPPGPRHFQWGLTYAFQSLLKAQKIKNVYYLQFLNFSKETFYKTKSMLYFLKIFLALVWNLCNPG